MIRSKKQYEKALARLDELIGAAEGTPEAAELDRLADEIEAYEKRKYGPVAPPPFAGALEFRMEQAGLKASQVAAMIGVPRSRITEYLSGTRKPSGNTIPVFHEKLGIPLECLVDTE